MGIKEELPAMTADIDWANFYRFAQKQSLLGVVFDGIQRLPKNLAPDADLLMRWMGKAMTIKRRNAMMYQASLEVFSEISEKGFRCCVLKGQGNAVGYPNPYSRSAGDVDVWILAERSQLRELALELAGEDGHVEREIVHHIELERKGISVELHPTPMIFNNPVLNHRMQRWFKRNADLQCSNIVSLPDGAGEIAIPTTAFNVIYQLSHLQHHFFYEGVGLRQVIDYYFVIKSLPQKARKSQNQRSTAEGKVKGRLFGEEGSNTDNTEYTDSPFLTTNCTNNTNIAALQLDLKRLGLWRFAGAVMWVLHEALGLPASQMIAPMDEKRGRLLLDEILSGGNFGQYRSQQHFERGTLAHNVQRLRRDLRLVRLYPAEALAEPFFRAWHFFWRLGNRAL